MWTRLVLVALPILFTTVAAAPGSQDQSPVTAPPAEIVVPFEHNARQNALLVRALINNRPALLLLDTGARASVVSREIAEMPGADLRGGFSGGGPGFRGDAMTMRTTVRLGSEVWYDHPVAVMNLSEVRRVYDGSIDGLLGEDLLCRFRTVTLDYPNKRIVLTKRR